MKQNTHVPLSADTDQSSEKTSFGLSEVELNLFHSRTVLITGSISQTLARDVCARLFALAHVSASPILILVSSPGGHVESGDMIHDVIRFIRPKVYILGSGWVASAGALIYVSVPLERRFATPNTRFLLHQPSGGAGGAASDIEIQAREIIKMRERLNDIFAKATNKTKDRIAMDTDRDHWMDADEAIAYGLCGKVVSSIEDIPL